MRKLIAVVAFVLAFMVNVSVKAETVYPEWNDVLKTCSAEYRERSDKTKGREVWNAFLDECKKRKGFVSKKDQTRGDFVRVPDKQ